MSYDELLALPEEEFEARLDGGDYRELQAMCKYIGISAGGSAGDLKRRLLEHKAQSDAPVKSPEGRTGRARSPRRAVAAPQSRASAVSEAVEAAERVSAARAASAGLIPGAMPPAQPGPSQPAHLGAAVPPPVRVAAAFPEVFAQSAAAASSEMAVDTKDIPVIEIQQSSFYGTPLGRTQRAQGVQSGFTPKLREEHQTLEAFLGGNEKSLPEAPPMPHVETTDPTMKMLLDGQAALLRGVNELRSTVVTRDALAHFYELQSQEMQTYVSAETAPLHDAVGRLGHDTQQLSRDAVAQFDRVGRLETQVEAIQGAIPNLDLERPRADWAKDAADPMYRSVGFFGWDGADDVNTRRAKIATFMTRYFPTVSYAIGFDYVYPRKSGKLKASCYATMLTRDEADAVLKAINTEKYKMTNGKNKDLKFDKPRSALQKSRWSAVKRAEAQLKNDKRTKGFEVKVESLMPVRKVLVDGKIAFEQTRGDAVGMFVGDFEGMELRDRER